MLFVQVRLENLLSTCPTSPEDRALWVELLAPVRRMILNGALTQVGATVRCPGICMAFKKQPVPRVVHYGTNVTGVTDFAALGIVVLGLCRCSCSSWQSTSRAPCTRCCLRLTPQQILHHCQWRWQTRRCCRTTCTSTPAWRARRRCWRPWWTSFGTFCVGMHVCMRA